MSENYNDDTPSPLWHNNDSEPLPYTDTSVPYDTSIPYKEVPLPSSNMQHVVPPIEPPEPVAPSATFEPGSPSQQDKLAAAHQLGEVIGIYKNDPPLFTSEGLPRHPRAIMLLGLGLFWIVLFWINGSVPHWILLLFLCAILVGWLNNIISRLPRVIAVGLQNTEFVQCASGLMIIKWGRVQAIRWEQIEAVQRIWRSGIGRTIIFLGDGKPLPIDSSLVGPGFVSLGQAIEREVRRHQLPRAIAAYEAGQTLNFGPLNVTPEGFLLEDGQQSLPWQRITAIETRDGNLIIKYNTTMISASTADPTIKEEVIESIWEEIDIAGMLNLCVLLPLVHHIRNVLRANEQKTSNVNTTYYEPSKPASEWSEYEY